MSCPGQVEGARSSASIQESTHEAAGESVTRVVSWLGLASLISQEKDGLDKMMHLMESRVMIDVGKD
jgi:hypothetical protein